jgi:predicted transcriptional regulator
MTTKRFMIYIDPDLLERLKKVAKKDKRSTNNAIAYAIEKYIESQEKGEQKHDEGV